MSWTRIRSTLLQAWYYQKHSLEAWVDTIWWSFFSLILFGFLALFFAQSSGAEKAKSILVGFILWDMVRLGNEELTISTLRDIWSRNLSNIFTTPISTSEFLAAQMIASIIRSTAVFIVLSILAWFFYGFSILRLSWALPLYYGNLLLFSWSCGMFIMGILFRFGTRLQAMAWSMIIIIQPITGVFYPISVLPRLLQTVAYCFPITYIFEAARQTYLTGSVNIVHIGIALFLNIIYFSLAWLSFHRLFATAKRTGSFAKLEG
ncbi:ABC transporter permease [Candidatus Roizmanbacteria bacterium]|nr:ABC transporter permease [Candidatus Roizmanbacteria bacterium]